MRPQSTLSERLLSRVVCDLSTRCWLSRRSNASGYRQMSVGNRMRYVHRIAYEVFVGPIQPGAVLDHLCRNPACCNPAHLEAVSHKTNCLRGVGFVATNATKTHCPKGHPYDDTNTYIRPSGWRECRECQRQGLKRRRHS